jgi:hypothetical protein
MKALAVFPGKPGSIHLADLPEPSVDDVPDGRGVQDMALAQGQYPGWLERLLTHPVQGLDNYGEMIRRPSPRPAKVTR